MKVLKFVTLAILISCLSCAAAIVGTVAASSAYVASAAGAPPAIIAIGVGAASFGTTAYINSLEEFKAEAPPKGTLARIFYEIRKLGESLIYALAFSIIAISLIFKKARQKLKDAVLKIRPGSKKPDLDDRGVLNKDDKGSRNLLLEND